MQIFVRLKFKISVRLNLFVFGSCFRTHAVILFQIYFQLFSGFHIPLPRTLPLYFPSPDFFPMYAVRCRLPAARLQEETAIGFVNVTSSLPIGGFSEAGLHE